MLPTLETTDALANATRALAGSPGADGGADGIEDVMEALSRVSVELLESYRKLAARAERMEQELCRTNAELERAGTHAALDEVGEEWVEHELCLEGGRPVVLASLRTPIRGDSDGEAGSIQIVEDRTELARLRTSRASA